MAKTKQSSTAAAASTTPNKSQAIREALAANPTASPKEIAEIVNAKYSLGVNGQYVSVVKSNARQQSEKLSGRSRRPRLRGTVGHSASAGTPSNAVDAAIGLIDAAGGLDQARSALAQLERLRGKL